MPIYTNSKLEGVWLNAIAVVTAPTLERAIELLKSKCSASAIPQDGIAPEDMVQFPECATIDTGSVESASILFDGDYWI